MILTTFVLAAAFAQEPLRLQPDLGARERRRQAEQHYQAGVDALRSERFEEAAEDLRQAVKLEPNFFIAYFSLGKTYLALKRYEDSVRAYVSCREAWDRSVAESMRQGFENESRVEDRIRNLRDQARELEGQMSTARNDNERSRIQAGLETIRVNIDSLARIRNRDRGAPDPPAEFPFALGSAYLRTGQIDEAEQAYREALKLRPKYGEAHSNLAVIWLKRGDYDQAHTHVKAAQKAGLKVHPQLAKAIEEGRRAAGK
jgi:Flp pilus assembly protein TadD